MIRALSCRQSGHRWGTFFQRASLTNNVATPSGSEIDSRRQADTTSTIRGSQQTEVNRKIRTKTQNPSSQHRTRSSKAKRHRTSQKLNTKPDRRRKLNTIPISLVASEVERFLHNNDSANTFVLPSTLAARTRYFVHSIVNKTEGVDSTSEGTGFMRTLAISKAQIKADETTLDEPQGTQAQSGGLLSRIQSLFSLTPSDNEIVEEGKMDPHPRFVFPNGLDRSAQYTLRILAAHSVRECNNIIDEMRGEGVQPHNITYNAAIRTCCKMGSQTTAFDYLDKMKDEGFHCTTASYNPLLFTYRSYEDMQQVIALMDHDSIKPSVVTFQMMAAACEQQGLKVGYEIAVKRESQLRRSLHRAKQHYF